MMPKIFRPSILCLIALLCYSCSGGGESLLPGEEDNGSETPVPTLTVSTEAISVNVLGGTRTFNIDSDSDWQAQLSDSEAGKWLTVTPMTGKAGVTTVSVTMPHNNDEESKAADIIITAGDEKASVKVEQSWAYYFRLPASKYIIDYEGGDIFIDGLQKIDYTISVSNIASSWLDSDLNVLKVGYNAETYARMASVQITDDTNNKTYNVIVHQDGALDENSVLEITELYINDYKCPSDNRNSKPNFMYSVDMDATTPTQTVKVEFAGKGAQWLTFGDDDTKVRSGSVVTLDNLKAGTTLKVKAHNKSTDKTGECDLIISGLPIMEIATQGTVQDEPKVDCDIVLFDPKARTDAGDDKNLTIFKSKAGIEYRGAGAQRYIKKPYNFKLYDDNGEKREAELLNIRNDNSWILDAMFLDVAHMRNRVCFDIWNEFNKPYYVSEKPKAMSGTRGYHIEVFLNGEYRGMFILSDRVDRKQYQIEQDGGYIYKAKGWSDACCLRSCSTPTNSSYLWGEIEQEYPDADDGKKPYFNYMADLITFVGSSSEADFDTKFEQYLDMNSLVDAFIYLNLIVAHDNIGRNTFWILRNVNESKKFMQGLWDLDGTLGRTWNRFTENPEQGWVSGGFRIYERIINENPANIHQKIYDRWNEIKDGPLAPSNFAQKLDAYAKIQKASGARDREVARWQLLDKNDRPKWGYADVYYGNVDSEIAYMKSWWEKRHAKLDKLINTLEHK